MAGLERVQAAQLMSVMDTRFIIRWRGDLEPGTHRVVFDGRTYDIEAVVELGRREGLQLDGLWTESPAAAVAGRVRAGGVMALRAKRRPRRLPTRDRMVVGVEEIQAVFRALPDAVQRTAVKSALEESAEVLLAAVQRTVPRGETGVLEASLRIFPVRKAKTKSSIRVGAGKEGWYGALLEYGTRHMPARPWIRPALDSAFGGVVTTFREEFGESVERESDKLRSACDGGLRAPGPRIAPGR